MKRITLAVLVFLGSQSGTSLGQAFGPGSQITVIPATAFRAEASTTAWGTLFGVQITPASVGSVAFDGPIDLPNGSVLEEIRVFLEDSDPANDIIAKLVFYGQGLDTGDCGIPATPSTWGATTLGAPGHVTLLVKGDPLTLNAVGPCGVSQGYFQYYIQVILSTPFQHTLSGAAVKWHRQVSPAPLTATFNDVPTNDPFFRAIEALAASGITTGCGNNNFCPNDVVTRNQLAKFLANALGLHFPQ